MRTVRNIVLAALALLVLVAPALAQSSTGRLIGTVVDPGGAVVPGATVVVKDNQTGRERTVKASNEGTFDVPQLEYGNYTVTITAQGYSTFTATDLKIDASRDYTLNAQLQVGNVTENVTVVAGADIVNSSDASLSNTVSPRQVKELPINGRNPLALLNTLPGVNPTSSSINGQRSSSTNYTRDGLNIQDNFIRTGGFVQDRPTVDDTGEFTATLQNATAQFGGSQVVQLVTPRGSAKFHGSLYEFNRNSEFGANSFFNKFNGVPRSFLNRNQFGGSFSGPVRMPHFGEGGSSLIRHHAFFFMNYEGFRQASQSAGVATTLLPAARTGTFTYTATCTNTGTNLCPAGVSPGQPITINVLTGTGLNLAGANATTFANAGGVLSIDPLVQSRILSRLPTSGNGILTGTNFTQAVNFNVSAPVTRNAYTGRFDLQINDRNALNFVYKHNNENNARTDLAYGFNTSPYVFQGGPTKFYVLAYNMTPTNRLSNEIRGGYQRSEPFFNEGGVPQDFVFSNAQTQSANTLAGIITNPEGSFRSQGRNTDYWNLQDNGTYTLGNHSFAFGGQLQAYRTSALNFAGVTPFFSFSTTSNPNTPGLTNTSASTGLFPGGINTTDLARANNLRYLLGGIIGAGSLTANFVNSSTGFQLGAPTIRNLRYENYSFYGQDQWRVSPRLTLTLGLRYELFTPLRNPDQIYLEPAVVNGETVKQAVLDPNGFYQLVGGNAGHPGWFFKTDKNNFGPTVSVAYSPTFKNKFAGRLFPGEGKTVIRAGYRVSYNSDEYERAPDNALLNNVGLGSTTINATLNGTANLRSVITPRGDLASFNPLPISSFTTPAIPTLPRPYAANNTAAVAGRFGTAFAVDPNFQVPLVHEYNVGIQREVGWQSAVEIRYVGSRSTQLVRSIDYNQIDIRNNGFLADFLRAQQNLAATGNNFATGPNTLTIIPNLVAIASGANARPGLSNATIISALQNGIPADLALSAIQAGNTGGVQFLANPNTGVANTLENGGRFNYNALQIDFRRRFVHGLAFQVNYTFQKTLADSTQESQTNVDPFIDIANPRLNYARPDYDRTHTVNGNMNYELPFGRGRRWLSEGVPSKIFGGFQLTSIVNISSGEPTSIRDPRGTLNRAGRSGLQPATSTLTTGQIKNLVGIFRTPNGVYYINPSVLQATATNFTTGAQQVVDLRQTLPAGFTLTSVRGASPVGSAPFTGQVFFQNAPGSTGNLPLNFINGPWYFNWNAGLFRNFKFGESKNLQLRAEAFNVLNKAQFLIGESSGIFNVNSTTFGRISSTYAPRIIQFGARFDF